MKAMLILIILFVCANLYSQDLWNDRVLTVIPLIDSPDDHERIAVFANHYGIHVLKVIKSANYQHVKYYRLNSAGGKESEYNFQNEYGDFPNIVGDENIIYAVYKKDYAIRIQVSFDGGSSWSFSAQRNFINGQVNCNAVDAAYSNYGYLHIVWSEKVGSEYESYCNASEGNGIS